MKKVQFLFLLFMAVFADFSSASSRQVRQNEGIIIIDVISGRITVNPNDYLSAQSVAIKILDGNDNVLAVAQTTPGQAVTFSRSGQERKVQYTYFFSNSDTLIIEDVILT